MSSTRDPSMGSGQPDTLLVAGKGQLRTFVLDKREVVVGRDPDCDIAIDDPALSRRHFVLRLGPPITVQDLGSKNGIQVRGALHRSDEPVELATGESVQVGGFSCLVMSSTTAVPSTSSRAQHELLLVTDPTPNAVSQTIIDVATSGINVLVLGESGVGKDVLAETLHTLSRRTGPLQRINCAALAEQLLESELFGHEKGAFTGATHARPGLLEAAHGGTVFLDEIGEISLSTQARLLRAIETREIIRLGATRSTAIDVRFICATNRELAREVADRRFRHDLYFRIDGITLRIPPLRERRSMIARLATTFAERAGATSLTTETVAQLEAHDWPGNVRELKAVIERAALLARGQPIRPKHLTFTPQAQPSTPAPVAAPAPAPSAAPTAAPTTIGDLDADQLADRERIVAALEACAQNQTRAAAKLGISRTALVTKLRIYRIPRPRS